jgi:hypothetical protein
MKSSMRFRNLLRLGDFEDLTKSNSTATTASYSRMLWNWATDIGQTGLKLVEAGGIEPPSEGFPSDMTTCLAAVLISLLEPPTAGSRGAIRFGSRPHTLRQENRPIPLNDVLSDPAGESR